MNEMLYHRKSYLVLQRRCAVAAVLLLAVLVFGGLGLAYLGIEVWMSARGLSGLIVFPAGYTLFLAGMLMFLAGASVIAIYIVIGIVSVFAAVCGVVL
jgi:hypothetical protein